MAGKYLKRFLHWVVGKTLAVLPLTVFEMLSAFCWRISKYIDPGAYWLGISRRDIGREVLGLGKQQTDAAAIGGFLEILLDWRMTAVSPANRDWPGLREFAVDLHREIVRLHREYPGCPVVISPLHYVSQYVNIHVCDLVRQLMQLKTLAVVSAVPYGAYGDDNSLVPNLKVFHTYADGARTTLGINFFRSLKKDGVAVLFADVTPFSLARAPMETVSVSSFGRPARIHNGVFRLGAPLHAKLLPFYLSFDRGRFTGVVFEPVELDAPEAPQQVAALIDQAILANYRQWLQAGFPAMYWFAPAK